MSRSRRRPPGAPLRRTHRRHAIRVALAATMVTAVAAVAIGVTLDAIVLRHLQAESDARLSDRLRSVVAALPAGGSASPGSLGRVAGHGDLDDAPALVWKVAPDGRPSALTSAAPTLPARRWRPGSLTTVQLEGGSFRVAAASTPGGWIVVGQSNGQIQRVHDELVVTELLLGGVLLVVVYGGALLIGLRASAPLEEVRRRQAAFTADASHELRTPLSVIQAEVGLALDHDRSGPYYRDTLRRVSDESYRLREIVDDLLWLARSDAGTELPPAGPVEVAEAARTAVARFAAVAGERGVTLELSGADPALVVAPAGWVERLLGVLVDNACRYCPEGGHVTVGVRAANGHVVLAVDDDGPGIPLPERARVLDRFHRASDAPGGTGLGLAIADSVVRTTGGEWLIGDGPLGGARFQVTWKAAPSPAASRRPAPVGG